MKLLSEEDFNYKDFKLQIEPSSFDIGSRLILLVLSGASSIGSRDGIWDGTQKITGRILKNYCKNIDKIEMHYKHVDKNYSASRLGKLIQ